MSKGQYVAEGKELAQSSKFEEAIGKYRQALELDPADKKLHFQIGAWHDRLDQTKEALIAYQQVVELDPSYSDVHFRIGDIYMHEGRLLEALDCFRRDVEVNPTSFLSFVNISFLLFATGRAEEGVDSFWQGVALFEGYQQAFNYFSDGLKHQVEEKNIPMALQFIDMLLGHPKTVPEAGALLGEVKKELEGMIH